VTDVLTFDLGEGYGEIIICPGKAGVNAKAYQISTEKEIILYVVHGILHLAGYDDKSPEDIRQMRSKEKELL
jgi:rRNA maturation RNase YbeY